MLKRIRALLKSAYNCFSTHKISSNPDSHHLQIVEENRKLRSHVHKLENLLQELQLTEKRYQSLLDISTYYAYTLRIKPERKVELEWATDSISKITNSIPPELSKNGTILHTIIHPEDKTLAEHRLQHLLSGQIDISEFKVVDKNRQVRWLRDICYPIWHEKHHKIAQIYGVTQDITEYKLSEEKLVEERNLLRMLIDHLPDDIYVKDTQSRYMLINEPLKRHIGELSFQDVIGKTDFDFVPTNLAQKSYDNEQTLLQSDQPLFSYVDHVIDQTTSDQKWTLITKIPIQNVDGQVVGLVGINRDITHLKMAEEALRQGRDFAEGIIDTAQVIILVLSKSGRIIRFNRYLEEISGYKLNDVKGKNWFTTFIPTEDQSWVRQQFLKAINNVQTKGIVSSLLTKGGEVLKIEWYDKTLKDPSDKTIGLLAIGQDVTDRRRFEQERNQLFEAVNKQREQLQALTQQLAKTQEVERKALTRELHDQIGQNLTALDLNLNIVQTQLSDNSTIAKDTIQKRIRDSLEIVSQTGDRIRDVMANLRPQILDDYGLVAAIRWYCQMFASRVDFEINVKAKELTPRLPTPVEDSLFRIVQEALTNIAKHAQPNLATVSINSYNDIICLTIGDDGQGFDVVAQTNPAEKQHWGLITMAERAVAVGGHCHVESQPGHGTRVIVEVPYRDHPDPS